MINWITGQRLQYFNPVFIHVPGICFKIAISVFIYRNVYLLNVVSYLFYI